MSKKDERQKTIQYLLLEKNMFGIHELCEKLKCSEATLRNDLRELESKGLVKRIYGGVMSSNNLVSSHQEAAEVQKEEKASIANYVVNHILKNDQTIILDIGTTTLAVAQHIFKSSLKLNVITNSLEAINVLSRNKNINLLVPGGEYDDYLDSFDTAETIDYYKNIHADYYFMSCNGIDTKTGFTVPFHHIVATKSVLQDHSFSTIVLADSTKIGKIASRKICDLSDVDMLVVDDMCSEEERLKLSSANVDIIYAPVVHKETYS